MIRKVEHSIRYLTENPKKLFLIDALGAMTTAFFLYVLLRNFSEYFGMPVVVLNALSVLAVCFCIYSMTCFLFLKGNWAPFIITISMANILYAVLTLGLIAMYYPELTFAGIAYFIIEIVIIGVLVYIEFKVAIKIRKNKLMTAALKDLIKKAYSGFNDRDIDKALSTMHPDVEWPKAFEGGYVKGHDAIREYWTRQWGEINPNVEPVGFDNRANGTVEIEVHQKVKDLEGNIVFDGVVKHIYTLEDDLLRKMDIE